MTNQKIKMWPTYHGPLWHTTSFNARFCTKWTFETSCGTVEDWAVQHFVWDCREQSIWLATVSSWVLNASYITARNKAKIPQLFWLQLKTMWQLSQCDKVAEHWLPCNCIFSGMLIKSFRSIAGIIQSHFLIFSLHEEPQTYWFIYNLQGYVLLLKPFFIGTVW